MHLASNMAQMAKGGFLRSALEEMQELMKKFQAKVREEKTCRVEFPGLKTVKIAIERHWAIVYTKHTDGCLPCQNGTAKNIQTQCGRKETGAPPPQLATPPPAATSAQNATGTTW
jgi:hypothetical protein